MYRVKSELENLSFQFRCPRDYELIREQLAEDKERTAEALKVFTDRIAAILAEKGLDARLDIRYRKPYSIWRDMKEGNCDFSHVPFKHYVRVIYQPMQGWISNDTVEKDTALYIYSVLAKHFKERPGSLYNYIDNPKDNGYQSFHVKFLNQAGAWEELHIGSERMHRNAKLGCVVERGESWLERFKTVLQNLAGDSDSFLFMEGVSTSLYNEDIIAFTPKGKGIILPKGATALDFAYEVHTDIGEKAQYARVNGKLCPLRTELHRGDCVEIGVSDAITPKAEWLDFAKTFKARRRLHELLKHQGEPEFRRCPVCLPLPGDDVVGFQDSEGTLTLHNRYCPEAIKLASENGDLIVSASFTADPGRTYPVRIKITAIDRYHLLHDIIDCFTEERHLSMDKIGTVTQDQIVDCLIDFQVHSADELYDTMNSIAAIPGVDEVQRISL